MHVPILMYHSLDDSGAVVSTSPALFRRQMEQLAAWGFVGIRLIDLLQAWDTGAHLPQRPIVLTFDDGYANVLQHAAPVLSDLNFSATQFVISGRAGLSNDFPGQDPRVPRLPLLDWRQIQELARRGWEIGAHSVTHPRLTDLSPDEARREIVDSKSEIEQRLGREVATFAYPYGLAGSVARAIVRDHFRAACAVRPGLAAASDDRARLPRIDAHYLRSPAQFRLIPTRWFVHYVAGRRLARTVREALARSSSRDRPVERILQHHAPFRFDNDVAGGDQTAD